MHSGVRPLFCAIGALLVSASLAGAQQAAPAAPAATDNGGGRRSVTALRLADGEAVTLDGRLDEPFWSKAVPAADFIQQDPQNGGPATEPTEVRIAFDSESLYMGVTVLRFRARQVARLPAAARRRAQFRRPFHVDDRHVPRRPHRLFLRDEPVGADGRCAARASTARIASGTGSGTRGALRSEIGWTLEIADPVPDAQLQSRTATPGASTFSAPSGARTKRASGRDGRATRACAG